MKLAHETFKSGVWSRAERHYRADTLEKIATNLSKALPTLIALEVQQTGRAVRELEAQVPSLTKWFRYYAALVRTEERGVMPTTGMFCDKGTVRADDPLDTTLASPRSQLTILSC